mmetsp:Transcript_1144/g.1601  ORF Transcript_1144/g.1601 Transcript_1144/m.1601 type:complete len:103 (-) Transcript_1144:180-488(-)|eukprot:CAMPEP_0196572414 /NCGR_PEP_ID=MMETSP1081-20130531/2480_1 /TAXON_ID=36882 /ORGANISM="Pyramimonas amylifera, Strain CCMP720" /LENGTH=102 /DNA_ID=CAMNT_0041889737 /DNA_START=64 /DNA_END=372 /DNA_ORIENTATION=+
MSVLKAIVPLFDRVLVQKLKPAVVSAGGILLPESSTSTKLNEGVVVAVGPGARSKDGNTIPMVVKSGDKVLLPEYGGTGLKIAGEEYSMYNEGEFLGIIKDN